MSRAVGEDSENELHLISRQRTEIDVDGVEFPFVNFMPFSEQFQGAAADLVLELEDYVAVICLVQAADLCLKMVT